MKRKIVSALPVLVILLAGLSLISWNYSVVGVHYPMGAPAGHTGSPGDGKNCTACHSGTAAEFQSGWITSDIPVTGYVPGESYTITASASSAGRSKFGFQVSPQDNSGNLLGTLSVTSSETQLTGSNKYVTHTNSGTSGSNNSKSWTFTWKAPAKGSGDVSFYGAFNATNSDNTSSGDIIYTSSLTVSENTTVGIEEYTAGIIELKVFPNPSSEKLNLKYSLEETSKVEIKIYSLDGKNSSVLFSGYKNKGEFDESYLLNRNLIAKGFYFLELSNGKKRTVEKVLIE